MDLTVDSRERGAGSARASIRHVAQSAGVSMSSVSRVLSGHPDVSAKMRERVLRVVKELRYEPDFLAQSLRRGATQSVGFALSDVANPPIAEFIHGAEQSLRSAGYSMLVMNSENDPSFDAEHIRLLQNRRVDGLILSLASERNPATLDAIAQLDIPSVVIDRDLPAELRASAVLFDHRIGMTAAAEHLLNLGHRRIALLSWPLELRPGRERLAGLQAAYAAGGLADTSISVLGLMSAPQAEVGTESLLDGPNVPTAIVAGANQLLIGCLRALRRRGMSPGPDLALVTCDDVPLAELYVPPIATIARDNMECGRVAADLLLRRLDEEEGPQTVILPTRFEPRASCGEPIPFDLGA